MPSGICVCKSKTDCKDALFCVVVCYCCAFSFFKPLTHSWNQCKRGSSLQSLCKEKRNSVVPSILYFPESNEHKFLHTKWRFLCSEVSGCVDKGFQADTQKFRNRKEISSTVFTSTLTFPLER